MFMLSKAAARLEMNIRVFNILLAVTGHEFCNRQQVFMREDKFGAKVTYTARGFIVLVVPNYKHVIPIQVHFRFM